VETTVSETHPRKMPVRSLATAIIAMLLVLLAGFSVWRWWGASTSSSERASIAVLPFENIGSHPKWERYADGITEDIVTDLSHSKDLFVAPEILLKSTEASRQTYALLAAISVSATCSKAAFNRVATRSG